MLEFDLSFGRRRSVVHRPHELLEQSFAKSIAVYFGVLAVVLGGSSVMFIVFRLHPLPPALILLGVVYLLAGTGRPRPIYLTLRSMGYFAKVSRPAALRRSMLMIGAILIVAGIGMMYFRFNPEAWPWSS